MIRTTASRSSRRGVFRQPSRLYYSRRSGVLRRSVGMVVATGGTGTTLTTNGFALELQGELNRLAHTHGLGEAAAANVWAGTTGHETVGALNAKAGNAAGNLKELQGVCNQLAGTSGLGPPGALSRIPA